VDADAQALPFRSNAFGLVFSSSVFQWINDLEGVFADAARILQPDGTFAFALYGRKTLRELRSAHRKALEEAGRSESFYMHTFPDEQQVRSALEGAGFQVEQLFSVDEMERHADVASLLQSLKKIGAKNAATSRPSGLPSRRIMLRLIDLYTSSYGEKDFIPATYHVIYVRARLGQEEGQHPPTSFR
ncbi:MAG TPA: methyltransferase domain-containing protein, partial [Desulfuromonadales bacterium]|nr:methyltransferase domain-containing protein [Desulfuromonadales bacterium]